MDSNKKADSIFSLMKNIINKINYKHLFLASLSTALVLSVFLIRALKIKNNTDNTVYDDLIKQHWFCAVDMQRMELSLNNDTIRCISSAALVHIKTISQDEYKKNTTPEIDYVFKLDDKQTYAIKAKLQNDQNYQLEYITSAKDASGGDYDSFINFQIFDNKITDKKLIEKIKKKFPQLNKKTPVFLDPINQKVFSVGNEDFCLKNALGEYSKY